VLALGASFATHLRAPTTRLSIAGLAVGLLAIRTAAFHAMGSTESFSTVDVAGGVVGIQADSTAALDAAGGAKVTPQVLEAGLQLALRFLLPWVLLLGAAVRILGDAASLRRLAADLALTFAARGAAIALALWAWWRNAWWISHAYPVYALGAADVVLLLVALLLCGGLGRDAPRPAEERRDCAPAGVREMMAPCSG
jgi:hypothetical protein